MSEDFRLGTWNMLSLYRSGVLRNLIQVTQDYKTDLLATQAIRWLGRSIIEKKFCPIYYSCDDKHFWNGEKLGIKEIKQEYVNKLVQWVQDTNEDHLNWAVLQQMVINTADEVTGKEERMKRIHRKKRKEYYKEQKKQVEKLHGEKECRRMYRLVNDIRKEFKSYMTVCRDSTGMILSEPSEITERWRQYFQNLLTNSDTISTEISHELEEGLENETEEIEEQRNENEAPKIDQVKKAIERLKSNKSPGPDNITAKLLKTKQEIIEETAKEVGLNINVEKTKAMVQSSRHRGRELLTVTDHDIEVPPETLLWVLPCITATLLCHQMVLGNGEQTSHQVSEEQEDVCLTDVL
ncbi:hypothetical protein Cfor_04817 [Coptotermes formosanus]|uniref:Reverse transcriptase domain-containing protein n=1 Tax=Coptotermes formosanus TaxID=36987 RepID=A0A6L2PZU0_COPFO|nr:hypothetical protein Cfor_04817 [Coptotermes formosanus]